MDPKQHSAIIQNTFSSAFHAYRKKESHSKSDIVIRSQAAIQLN